MRRRGAAALIMHKLQNADAWCVVIVHALFRHTAHKAQVKLVMQLCVLYVRAAISISSSNIIESASREINMQILCNYYDVLRRVWLRLRSIYIPAASAAAGKDILRLFAGSYSQQSDTLAHKPSDVSNQTGAKETENTAEFFFK